jgi:hypothetical protein
MAITELHKKVERLQADKDNQLSAMGQKLARQSRKTEGFNIIPAHP